MGLQPSQSYHRKTRQFSMASFVIDLYKLLRSGVVIPFTCLYSSLDSKFLVGNSVSFTLISPASCLYYRSLSINV